MGTEYEQRLLARARRLADLSDIKRTRPWPASAAPVTPAWIRTR